MALTGMQIFKLLPKTNCKECGVPTCLAFAMNLASGKAELDACPYVSDEARAQHRDRAEDIGGGRRRHLEPVEPEADLAEGLAPTPVAGDRDSEKQSQNEQAVPSKRAIPEPLVGEDKRRHRRQLEPVGSGSTGRGGAVGRGRQCVGDGHYVRPLVPSSSPAASPDILSAHSNRRYSGGEDSRHEVLLRDGDG